MFKENLMKERLVDFSEATPDMQVLLRLQRLIELNYKINKNANYYVDAIREDAFKLNRIVLEYTGKTVHELVGERVLQEAEILLGVGASLENVAEIVGFSKTIYLKNYLNKFCGDSQILKKAYEEHI